MRHWLIRTSTLPASRRAFTLVEILVSIVIMGIIGSMVAIALSGAQRQAQQTRARAYIDRLNLVMLQLYEEAALQNVGMPSSVWTAETTNQSQLIWRRDWLRATLPDCRADVDAGSGRAGSPSVFSVPVLEGDGTLNSLAPLQRNLASLQYRERVRRTYEVLTGASVTWDAAYATWTDEHASAECLYLIFATKTFNGTPLIDQLRSRDIADTDDDGMPEIVDPWGEPVRWMRWPVGFYLKNRWVENETVASQWPTVGELRETVARLGEDPIDILRGDPRHAIADNTDAATDTIDPNAVNANIEIDKLTFFVRPLVVSAGADGEFDLVERAPGAGRETVSDDAIASLTASSRVLVNGVPVPHPLGYPTPVYFPDPFFTLTIVNPATGATLDGPRPLLQRIGAVTDVDGDRVDDSADNIYPVLGL